MMSFLRRKAKDMGKLKKEIASDLGIPESKVNSVISKLQPLIREEVESSVKKFLGRRSVLEGGVAVGTLLALSMGLSKADTVIPSYKGGDYYALHVEPYDIIVGKEGKKVKAYNTLGKLIAVGKAGVSIDSPNDDTKVWQKALNQGGIICSIGTFYLKDTLHVVVPSTKIFNSRFINNTTYPAISVEERECVLWGLYVKSKGDGIVLNPGNSPPSVESRVENCKIESIPTSLWTYGIRENTDNTDNYIVNNIINGFTGGIILEGGGSLVQGNHIYRLPAEKYYRGIVIRSYGCRIFNNYIDKCSGICFYIPLSVGNIQICSNTCTIYTNNPGNFVAVDDNAKPSGIVIKNNLVHGLDETPSLFEVNLSNCSNLVCEDNICSNMSGVKVVKACPVYPIELIIVPGEGAKETRFGRPIIAKDNIFISYNVAAGDTVEINISFIYQDGTYSSIPYTYTINNSAGTSSVEGTYIVSASDLWDTYDDGKTIIGLKAWATSSTGATTANQIVNMMCILI